MHVVAYYTIGTAYETFELPRLLASARRVGLEVVVYPVANAGDWYKNTAQKATVLAKAREELAGPLLYVDADAVFHVNPTAELDRLVPDFDFAAHYFSGKVVDSKMLSGTMWLNDTPAVRQMLEHWLRRNAEKQAAGNWVGGGQLNLAEILPEREAYGLRVHKLPGRYCYIFDKPWAYPEGEPRWIEHLQASRENRLGLSGRINEPRRKRIAELENART